MTEPKQITLRHPSPALARRLRMLAEARGKSLNATILEVLEDAVGGEARRERLLRWATWSEADAAEFDAAVNAQREIDAGSWR